MSTVKKVPQRQCIGCGEMKNKRELIRVLKGTDDVISIDATERKNGRGAYICPSMACFEKAVKTTCFLADIADFAVFNEIYGKYFTGKPSRSCVAVRELPKGALAEVEVIAVV